jgi:hypothetical protein
MCCTVVMYLLREEERGVRPKGTSALEVLIQVSNEEMRRRRDEVVGSEAVYDLTLQPTF